MRLLLTAMLLLTGAAVAQQAPPPPPLEPVPDGPPVAGQPSLGEELQPQVTIRRRAEDTIEEYRVNGQLYMIRVIPRKGIPYYLVDSNGDGRFETRYNDLDNNLLIPGWVLFSW